VRGAHETAAAFPFIAIATNHVSASTNPVNSSSAKQPPPADAGCVIAGAGQAGANVALTLRQRGYQGGVLLVGDEPYPPYERPALSKEILLGSRSAADCCISSPQQLAELGISLLDSTTVVHIDRARRIVHLSGGSDVGYRTLVIATGCRPRTLNPALADLDSVAYLRTLDDALRLKRRLSPGQRLAIIGAGYIGLEVAAAAIALGCEVTVIDREATAMTRVLPAEISRRILDVHETAGVRFRFGRNVTSMEKTGGAALLHLDDATTLPADQILVAVGVIPNDGLAAEAGLEVADGVVVDQNSQTSDPSIYAVGDVSKRHHPIYGRGIRLESWQNAQNQSIAAAKHICGASEIHAELPWFWSNQFGMNIQIVGTPLREHRTVFRDYGEGRFAAFCLDRGRLAATVTVNRPRDIGESRRLILNACALDVEKLRDPAVPLRTVIVQPEEPLESRSH
jgi:NADPH-dependent 2,4-dienoyl-CoA reductase/sulfur reductase-like enzyme